MEKRPLTKDDPVFPDWEGEKLVLLVLFRELTHNLGPLSDSLKKAAFEAWRARRRYILEAFERHVDRFFGIPSPADTWEGNELEDEDE